MKTIIFKFTNTEQYNPENQIIIWEDNTPSRWSTNYHLLSNGDRGFFIAPDRVYSGTLTGVSPGISLQFSGIENFLLNPDDFLSIDAVDPEVNAQAKAQFHPFITDRNIDYERFAEAAQSRRFIRFFIVKKDQFLIGNFLENDRVVLISSDMVFEELGIIRNGTYDQNELPPTLFNVKGKSISEARKIFQDIAERKQKERSNNVNQLNKIERQLQQYSNYEFNSFSSYYNTIHNIKAYVLTPGNAIDYYVAGAAFGGGHVDQLDRFLKEGIWQHDHDTNYYDVVSNIPKGSQIAIKALGLKNNELKIKAIGEVIANPGDGQTLEVNWDEDFEPFTIDGTRGFGTTIRKATDPKDIQDIFFRKEKPRPKILTSDMQHALNTILYGPPGTGKTYATIEKALNIILNGNLPKKEGSAAQQRAVLKDLYEGFVTDKRIQFITFHQSMSYEEFIEGIRPMLAEKGELQEDVIRDIQYRLATGLFKQMAVDASLAYVSREDEEVSSALEFSDLYDTLINYISDQLDHDKPVMLKTKTEGQIEVFEITERNNLGVRHSPEGRRFTVSRDRLEVLYTNIPDLSKVSNVSQTFSALINGMNSTVYWSVLNKLLEIKHDTTILKPRKEFTSYSYEEKVNAVNKIDWKKVGANAVDNYVLIIDEINRGNISAIFGELITLLEDDKRAGRAEAISATLPYSQKPFTVPPNLYIIGTMNTADRSVESLDNALRRRFSFEFMPPQDVEVPEEVDGIRLRKAFQSINERLSWLLDQDHQIGHSYFMGASNAKDVKAIFRNKVIPLLKEYFYGDYGKIRLVLGDGFVEKKDNYMPSFPVEVLSEFAKELFVIREIDDSFPIKAAIDKLG